MTQATPIVRGDTLVYQQQGHEQTLVVGTPAWYAWLRTATTFAFRSEVGTFTAHKERAGNKRGATVEMDGAGLDGFLHPGS